MAKEVGLVGWFSLGDGLAGVVGVFGAVVGVMVAQVGTSVSGGLADASFGDSLELAELDLSVSIVTLVLHYSNNS